MFYCLLAPGFEEIEAITTVDILRRAGLGVLTVAVTENNSLQVTGAHNITVTADKHISDTDAIFTLTGVILPGGMPGTTNLEASDKVKSLITYCAENDKYIFAICAAPQILGHMGLLKGKKATCYPGFESELEGAEYLTVPAVQDGMIITGRGPGASVDFAMLIVSELFGADKAAELRDSMQCHE